MLANLNIARWVNEKIENGSQLKRKPKNKNINQNIAGAHQEVIKKRCQVYLNSFSSCKRGYKINHNVWGWQTTTDTVIYMSGLLHR